MYIHMGGKLLPHSISFLQNTEHAHSYGCSIHRLLYKWKVIEKHAKRCHLNATSNWICMYRSTISTSSATFYLKINMKHFLDAAIAALV